MQLHPVDVGDGDGGLPPPEGGAGGAGADVTCCVDTSNAALMAAIVSAQQRGTAVTPAAMHCGGVDDHDLGRGGADMRLLPPAPPAEQVSDVHINVSLLTEQPA